MGQKLDASRAKGRGSWRTCPAEALRSILDEDIAKGDPVEIGLFAMMLYGVAGAGNLPGNSQNRTKLEKQMGRALWKAWIELNAIHARDGVPRTRDGSRCSIDEGYFSDVVKKCAKALRALIGRPDEPWMPTELLPA